MRLRNSTSLSTDVLLRGGHVQSLPLITSEWSLCAKNLTDTPLFEESESIRDRRVLLSSTHFLFMITTLHYANNFLYLLTSSVPFTTGSSKNSLDELNMILDENVYQFWPSVIFRLSNKVKMLMQMGINSSTINFRSQPSIHFAYNLSASLLNLETRLKLSGCTSWSFILFSFVIVVPMSENCRHAQKIHCIQLRNLTGWWLLSLLPRKEE